MADYKVAVGVGRHCGFQPLHPLTFYAGIPSEGQSSLLSSTKAASTLEQKCARGRPRRGMRSNVDL